MIENQTDSTVASTDAETHDRLRAGAEAFDRGEGANPLETLPSATNGNEAATEGTEARADGPGATKPDNPESSAEPTPDGRKRGPDGKFLPKEEVTPTSEKSPKSEAPTEGTKSYKEQKEAQRLEKTWQNVEREKAEVRAERERVARLAQDVEELKRSSQQSRQSDGGPNLSSREYATAAHTFYQKGLKLVKDGEIEAAQEQFDLAAQAQGEANKRAADEYQQHQTQSLQERASKWRSTAEAVIKEVPEYGDGNSEQSQAMQQLLRDHPLLGEHEHGFRYAHEILTLRKDAAEASGLREENTELKAENERLNKLTSLHGGKPNTQHSKAKPFDQMTMDEQRAHLRANADELMAA